jgi:hypothetical protein
MILLFNGMLSSLSMVYDREMGSMKRRSFRSRERGSALPAPTSSIPR